MLSTSTPTPAGRPSYLLSCLAFGLCSGAGEHKGWRKCVCCAQVELQWPSASLRLPVAQALLLPRCCRRLRACCSCQWRAVFSAATTPTPAAWRAACSSSWAGAPSVTASCTCAGGQQQQQQLGHAACMSATISVSTAGLLISPLALHYCCAHGSHATTPCTHTLPLLPHAHRPLTTRPQQHVRCGHGPARVCLPAGGLQRGCGCGAAAAEQRRAGRILLLQRLLRPAAGGRQGAA